MLGIVAVGELGRSKSSARTEREVVAAAQGVVQSTVTGTGSLEPVTEEDVDFQTSGTLARIYVEEGDYVHKGQLLAKLDDTTALLTLKQAKATLAEARTTLKSDKKTLADSSSTDDTSETTDESPEVEEISYSPNVVATTKRSQTATTTTTTSTAAGRTGRTTTSGTTTAGTTTSGTATTSGTTNSGAASSATTTSGATGTTTTSGSDTTTTGTSSANSSSSSSDSSTVTASTIDADRLQIVEDEQTVKEDRDSLKETRLRAPVSGTLTSLDSIEPGDSVSSGSDSSASSDSSDSSGTSTDSTSTSGSTDTSSAFAEIDTLKRLSMTVSFTEADINKLKVGQSAVVTLDALSDLKLAGKVTEVSALGTTTDDVTSYDATVTLNQSDSRVKPGMSASAEVIVKQGRGVTVPSSAVTGTGSLATVTEEVGGHEKTKKVIVGIRGDSRDLIVAGLSSGAELVETETLPSTGSSAEATSSTTSSSGLSSSLGGHSTGGSSGAFSGAPGSGGPP